MPPEDDDKKEPKTDDKGSEGKPPVNGDTIPKARFDEVIAERNKLRADAEARAELDRKATEKKAIEDGKLQEVIDAKTAEIAQLTVTAARFDALVKALEPQIDAESKDWPDEAKSYLAIAETIEKKLELLPVARSLAAKLANGGTTPPPGTGTRPPPKGGPDQKQQDVKLVQDAVRQGSYGF